MQTLDQPQAIFFSLWPRGAGNAGEKGNPEEGSLDVNCILRDLEES